MSKLRIETSTGDASAHAPERRSAQLPGPGKRSEAQRTAARSEARSETQSSVVVGPETLEEKPAVEEKRIDQALDALDRADRDWQKEQVHRAASALVSDAAFREVIQAIGTVENASNALAVAMTYLREYPAGAIGPEHVKQKMVGHVGATTAISRTYLNLGAALKEPEVAKAIEKLGIDQAHVVTGPGHGAAAIFALLFLEGSLEKIYPDRYPKNAAGLRNLIADFCRPGSPLPSHVFPGVPSVSEGGELGYSLGVAAGAGIANPDAVIIAQIGDKESEAGPLQASLENHNAIYDFRKGLVLPVVHANGLGISGTAIISARSDGELRSYLRGIGYAPFIVDAESNDFMRAADAKAKELEAIRTKDPKADTRSLESEIRDLRQKSADLTNAVLQRYTRQGIYNLAKKREIAQELETVMQSVAELEKKSAADPKDELLKKRLGKAKEQEAELGSKLRAKRTPIIIYREAKGGGHAPAFVHGKATKGAPESHQLILSPQDLLSEDPSTRAILEKWLGDLTGGLGPEGLLPKKGTPLGDAAKTVFPKAELRSGAAPLAVGKADTAPIATPVEPLLKPFGIERGKEKAGSNELIDLFLRDYLTTNEGRAFLLSADTAESNRLKKTMAALGRHINLPTQPNHPSTSGPSGEAIDVLSEQYLMSLAQGMVNSGRQAIISNYEAFFQITASMIRQFIKFRKQAVEANALAQKEGHKGDFRPPVPNLVLHLSSLAFEQDHNGFSHQNPGLLDDLVSEPRGQVAVYMPPEANTAALQMSKAVSGKGQVAALVADKQPRGQFLSPEEAKELASVGAAAWGFASSVDPKKEKPDVVLAASGGYHTDEVLAASRIMKQFNQELAASSKKQIRFSVVNVAEPLKLRAPADQDDLAAKRLAVHGRKGKVTADTTVFDDGTFSKLFPKNASVVYAFGGFKRTAQDLLEGRERDVGFHGYINEGSTTTRFDMMVRNRCDRFSLVTDVVERAFKKGGVDKTTRDRIQQWCADQLIAHDERMARGEEVDPAEIVKGVWGS
jgi:xylulose-5-phosphate/fructose-6-phosphate phosphoketolase